MAVVGAGLSGLAAAWWLQAAGHRVTLFEQLAQPGFTARNVEVLHAGQTHRIDVPLRVFYPGYYPTLGALYDELGVASEPVSYAATLCGPDRLPHFRYRNLRWGSQSFGWLAPQDLLLGRTARRIVGGLLRFHRQAPLDLARGALDGCTIADYLAREAYPQEFVAGFVLPALCTVATCSYAQGREIPAAVVVDYLVHGLARQAVHRVRSGADEVLKRVLPVLAGVHCDAAVVNVLARDDRVTLHLADGQSLNVDHAVLAAPAHQSRTLLAPQHAAEAELLARFRYEPVEVLTHRDESLMPRNRRDWSPVNLHLTPDAEAPESTIWVNAVQPLLRDAEPVFQTVHPLRQPDPARVLGRARFDRPMVGADTASALATLDHLQAQPGRRLWFCGSYAAAGIPLLESAASSARRVVQAIGPATP
ncbi:MAG: FAD-dependent oxidoreductase [Rubrivivax sp.]